MCGKGVSKLSKSVIKNKLKEDLQRVNQNIKMYESKINDLPQGYLREKKINNNSYFYLRKRKGNKIQDKYVKKDQVQKIKKLIHKRRFLEKSRNELVSQKVALEKILRKELKNDK